MKKIRLMHITHDLAIGGLQQVVVNLCQSANRDIFDVSVLCLRKTGIFEEDILKMGIPVYQIPHQNKKRTNYFSFLGVRKIIKEKNIDVLHTHNTQPFIDGTLGSIFTNAKTIVHTDHARDFPDKKRYMFAEWLMAQKAYKVVGVSNHTTNNLHKYEKINKQKLITIPNGVSKQRFDITINKKELRQKLGIHANGPVIGLGVRLTRQKGLSYLLQAAKIIINEWSNLSLVIAGEGPLLDDLRKKARHLNIEKNVFFIGPRKDIPQILKILDIYTLPSLWEGLPMVLLEAMAAGCPIVATAVGGNSMAIQHNVNGYLVPPKDPESFAEAVITILKDENIQSKFVRNSLRIFDQKFSADIMTRQYEALYQKQHPISHQQNSK